MRVLFWEYETKREKELLETVDDLRSKQMSHDSKVSSLEDECNSLKSELSMYKDLEERKPCSICAGCEHYLTIQESQSIYMWGGPVTNTNTRHVCKLNNPCKDKKYEVE